MLHIDNALKIDSDFYDDYGYQSDEFNDYVNGAGLNQMLQLPAPCLLDRFRR